MSLLNGQCLHSLWPFFKQKAMGIPQKLPLFKISNKYFITFHLSLEAYLNHAG